MTLIPADIQRLSGVPDYYSDHLFSAIADAAFPLASTVAHLGAHGWRERDKRTILESFVSRSASNPASQADGGSMMGTLYARRLDAAAAAR